MKDREDGEEEKGLESGSWQVGEAEREAEESGVVAGGRNEKATR